MQKFEIRVTSYEDDSELFTVDTYAEDFQSVQLIIEEALESKNELAFHHGDEYIAIYEYSEGGYYYSRYASKEAYENEEEDIDGGLCTSTLSKAIEMALG